MTGVGVIGLFNAWCNEPHDEHLRFLYYFVGTVAIVPSIAIAIGRSRGVRRLRLVFMIAACVSVALGFMSTIAPRMAASGHAAAMSQDLTNSAMASVQREAELRREMDALHVDDVVAARNLVTAEGIADGRTRITKWMQLREQSLREYVALGKKADVFLASLPADQQSGAEKQLATIGPKAMEMSRHIVELDRRLIDDDNQILDLAQTSLGKSHLDGTKIILPDQFVGAMNNLIRDRRGVLEEISAEATEFRRYIQAARGALPQHLPSSEQRDASKGTVE